MKEINDLISRSLKYLNSAKVLIEIGDYESSVSRSYYAMLYSAQAIHLTKQLTFSSHKGVITSFGDNFIKIGISPKETGR